METMDLRHQPTSGNVQYWTQQMRARLTAQYGVRPYAKDILAVRNDLLEILVASANQNVSEDFRAIMVSSFALAADMGLTI